MVLRLGVLRQVLKSLLPEAVIKRLKKTGETRKRFAAYKERLAPFLGIAKATTFTDEDYCLSMLRMYAHVIDKGLHRSDWEPGHSRAVFEKAQYYLALCRNKQDPTLSWATRILNEYATRSSGRPPEDPDIRDCVLTPPVSSSALMGHFEYRTSCRQFIRRPLSGEDVARIVQAALEAASSCHRETLRVYATITPDLASDLAACFHGYTGFSDYLPCLFVFCADLRPYSYPAELFTPVLDTSLAVQNAVLMASAMGLSMTLLNWTARRDADAILRKEFRIRPHEEIIIGAACGFPDSVPFRPIRKPISKTLTIR